MKDIFGKCGNNCGRCPLFAANFTDERRQWIAEGMARYHKWHPNPANLKPCAGCQTDAGFHYIRNCAVRDCARFNGARNCAYCAEFACRDVPTVSVSVEYRDKVAQRLGSPIPEADYLSFIEPYEGIKHLAGIRGSLNSAKVVAAKEAPPLNTRISAFPENLPFPPEELSAFRAWYDLMARILTGQARLYVHQALLKAKRSVILNLWWVFGCCGELRADEAQLIIAGQTHAATPAIKNIVRKRDNAFHSAVAQSVELLNDFGVTIQHIPLTGKTWQLTMLIEENVGGVTVLKALKHYCDGLVEAYGEPTYAGSYRYKGEAFTRFSKLDMKILAGEN